MNRTWLVPVLAVLTGACAERAPGPAALTAADSAAALEQGGRIATAVAQGLVQRLQAQLAAEGAVGAVEFCSQTALALTDSLVAGEPAGTAVRRTSLRVRNPANRPDSLELAALTWFDSAFAAGTPPQALVQQVGAHEVRFYRPLLVQSFCLQCHGAPDRLASGVAELLAERYPEDRATGYADGDLRGVIRVSLPR